MVTSSARSFHLAPFAALLAVLVWAASGHATCNPTTDPDKTDIANARAAVAANCSCTGATVTHGTYVSCAAQQANAVLTNKSCAGFVKKCASHSTCGKPGTVTCCSTTARGTTCKIKANAAHCIFTGKQGTVGTCTSCCDACPTPGSGPSCPAPPPVCGGPDASGFCGGSCPTGSTCAATSSTACGCVPDGQLCNFVSGPPQPMCGGSCPFVTDSCFVVFEASQFRCVCATFCGMQSGVTCPDQPACLPGRTCNPGIGSACLCN